jgi:hypothetical protein
MRRIAVLHFHLTMGSRLFCRPQVHGMSAFLKRGALSAIVGRIAMCPTRCALILLTAVVAL